MKPIREMSQGELAAFVDDHLQLREIEVVLSGGAAVAIYSMNKYVSKDIDLVARFSLDYAAVRAAMEELGFEKRGRYYHHKDSDFFVDFVSGPPSVGREPIREIHKVTQETGSVRIISPTDSVKDHLAAFFYFNDRQALEQALLVAQEQEIDLSSVDAWADAEGNTDKFGEFFDRLGK